MIEPTVTQNSALYFAQHKIPQPRPPFGRRFASVIRKHRRKAVPHWPAGAVFVWPGAHKNIR
jgi:hypothetical protein